VDHNVRSESYWTYWTVGSPYSLSQSIMEDQKQRFELERLFQPILAQLIVKKEFKNNSNFLSDERYSEIIANLVRIRDCGMTSQKLDSARYKRDLRLVTRWGYTRNKGNFRFFPGWKAERSLSRHTPNSVYSIVQYVIANVYDHTTPCVYSIVQYVIANV